MLPCICWVTAFLLIDSFMTYQTVKTWSKTSHQAGKPKKYNEKTFKYHTGMEERFFFGCRKLSPLRFGLGVGANQLLFQLGGSWDENLHFHLTATTRIVLFFSRLSISSLLTYLTPTPRRYMEVEHPMGIQGSSISCLAQKTRLLPLPTSVTHF